MARVNLSVPDEMKQHMDQLEQINWSSVAQEAFAHQIKLENLKGNNMETMNLERLRKSRVINLDTVKAQAQSTGKAWALGQAQFAALERVAALQTVEYDLHFVDIGAAILGEDDSPSAYYDAAFRAFGIEDAPSEDVQEAMANGFVQGAAEVLEQV